MKKNSIVKPKQNSKGNILSLLQNSQKSIQIFLDSSKLNKLSKDPEFCKQFVHAINNSPEIFYNILIKKLFPDLSSLLNLKLKDNILTGFYMDNELDQILLEKYFEIKIKRKYLYLENFELYIPELDFIKFPFEWVMIDLKEKYSTGKLHQEWIEAIHKQRLNCEKYGIPFYFKGWGKAENHPNPNDPTLNPSHRYYNKAGCMLDDRIYYYDPITKTTASTIHLFENDYYIMDEYKGLYTIWELKSYLPIMKSELFESLKENIAKNGLNDPILYYITSDNRKIVIEGHTRLKACIDLDIKNFPIKEVKEDFNSLEDIQLWMLKHQFQRRNLSSIERLELAYQSKDIIEKRAKINLSKAGKGNSVVSVDTNLEIANLAGVGKTTVVSYSNVIKNGSPKIIDKMKKGEISVSGAFNRIKDKPSKKHKINPEIIYLKSFDEGMNLIENKIIEGIIILKTEDQINKLTSIQKAKFGILILQK